ncbi:kinase-like domain-containing protein [Globomyces pollinis-pini]|nr:kinase-like domain-containing protein [Globomyces pollinis-pini]
MDNQQFFNQSQNRPNSFVSNASFQRPTSFVADDQKGPYHVGQILSIKGYEVIIERFLAEGGYAHVYVCTLGDVRLVLKRVSCPDQQSLTLLIQEAETHKKLSGHPSIVQFFEYSYNALPNGQGFELQILMEFCQGLGFNEFSVGGHLVDYLNSRLQNRPNESEVLNMFSQICEGVAHMHSFNPPIIHRDLKIENVLLQGKQFKLCDFGSCTSTIIPANYNLNIQELRKLEEEISKYTTLQYRAPEMCDLYQKSGMNEQVDIWALGVLLYKLCYYTTPFEESGKMSIMNGTFTFPSFPVYSDNIKSLISICLQCNIGARPTIYQLFERVCNIRGLNYSLKIKPQPFAFGDPQNSVNKTLLMNESPFREVLKPQKSMEVIDVKIAPMRRGRPQKGGTESTADLTKSQTNLAFVNIDSSMATAVDDFQNMTVRNNAKSPNLVSQTSHGNLRHFNSNSNLKATMNPSQLYGSQQQMLQANQWSTSSQNINHPFNHDPFTNVAVAANPVNTTPSAHGFNINGSMNLINPSNLTTQLSTSRINAPPNNTVQQYVNMQSTNQLPVPLINQSQSQHSLTDVQRNDVFLKHKPSFDSSQLVNKISTQPVQYNSVTPIPQHAIPSNPIPPEILSSIHNPFTNTTSTTPNLNTVNQSANTRRLEPNSNAVTSTTSLPPTAPPPKPPRNRTSMVGDSGIIGKPAEPTTVPHQHDPFTSISMRNISSNQEPSLASKRSIGNFQMLTQDVTSNSKQETTKIQTDSKRNSKGIADRYLEQIANQRAS